MEINLKVMKICNPPWQQVRKMSTLPLAKAGKIVNPPPNHYLQYNSTIPIQFLTILTRHMNIPIDFITRYLNIFHFSSSLPKLIFQSTPKQYLHCWNCCYSPHQILPLLLVLVLPPQLHRARRGGGGAKPPPPPPHFFENYKE